MSVFRFCSPKRRKKKNKVTPYVYGSGSDRLHFFLQKELEKVSLLRSQESESQQEEEEDVWRQWEEHRQQIAAEQNLLADKENALRKELQHALQELEAVRKQLSTEQGKFRSLMDEQVRRFLRANPQDLEWSPNAESKDLGIQAMYDFAELVGEEKRLNGEMTDKDKLLGIADLYGAEIQSLRNSFEGQKRQLMHVELIEQLKAKDSLSEVKEKQKKIEELFLTNTEKIDGEKKELEDRERRYQQQDSEKLHAINSQREKIERLEQRQRQLIMYIEEKEREKYWPDSERVEPIGESCSEESLAGLKSARYTKPTKSSLLKKQHGRSTSEPAVTFPNKRRYLSPVQVHNIQANDNKTARTRPGPVLAPSKSKEPSLAKQVTDRLYHSQEKSSPKQKRKAQETSEGHMRSKSAPSLKADKRLVPVGMVPSAPRLRHSSSSLASVPESCDERYQRTDHDTSMTDTIDISYDESSRMYDSESLRFSESESRMRARSASPSISLAMVSGRSSAVDHVRSNVTSRGEGSGDEVRDDTRTTPEGLGEKLTDHNDAHIPFTEAELLKQDTFHSEDEMFDPSVHMYHRKEQSPSPMRTRQSSEGPAGRGNSRGRGRAKDRYIPGKMDKTQPRPGQTTKTTSSVMKETASSKAKRASSKEGSQSPQLSRNSSKENGRSPQLGRSSSRESVSSNLSGRSVSRSSVSSMKSDRSASVASNKSERERSTSKDAQLVHMDSASSVDSSSLSQTSSSQSGTKTKTKDSKTKDSGLSDSKKSDKKAKRKKGKSEKSLVEKVLSKPKKKKGDVPVEIFIAGGSGGSGGTSLDMGENNEQPQRTHNDPAHELFARSLRGGSIEKEYRPFTEEVFSSSDGAKYIIRRRQTDDQMMEPMQDPDRSQDGSKPYNLAVERMISGESHHSNPESMDSLENPAALSMSLPNWKLAQNANGMYSDDSLDERMSPEGRKQSPRDAHSPATTNKSRFSYDSLDDENRAPSVGRSTRSTPAPVSPTRLEPVADCEVLTSGEYQPSHISVDSLMDPGLGQSPVQPDNDTKESPRAAKTSGKKREGSFKSRKNRQQHLTAAEADVVVNLSDDSLASSGELKPSSGSRPSSASKRRRKPRPSSASKKSKHHSSEEYADSDNDSVYSEDSLGAEDKKDQLLIKTIPQSAPQMASITENVEALTTALQDEYSQESRSAKDTRDAKTADSRDAKGQVQRPKSVIEMDFDNREHSPKIEYHTRTRSTPKIKATSQQPAEERWLTEDIVIELDSDPAETVDGSSDFGSIRLSYGRELTPGRSSDDLSVDQTPDRTAMDMEVDMTMDEPLGIPMDASRGPQTQERHSSSSSHSPASSTDSSPLHQDFLASSDQYSPHYDDTNISVLSSGLQIDVTLPTLSTSSKVPETDRDYYTKLNTSDSRGNSEDNSKDNSLTAKLEFQLDSNSDNSSAIDNYAVQDRYNLSDKSPAKHGMDHSEWGHGSNAEMPSSHDLDLTNDPRMDYRENASMSPPHVVLDDTHVTSMVASDHAISMNDPRRQSVSPTVRDSMQPNMYDAGKSTSRDNAKPETAEDKKVRRAESLKNQEKTKSPGAGGHNRSNSEGHFEEVVGLSPRSDSLHESSESTVSNETVIEVLRDTSASSADIETDITDVDDEMKSTPTHASYSGASYSGGLTEEEGMPLSTRWSSSDSAIDVVEDHPVTSHPTSESETQRDSGAHSADDTLDEEYRPVKMMLPLSKGQYNQDSVANKSSSKQDPGISSGIIRHRDLPNNHKQDPVDLDLHEFAHVPHNKDVSLSGAKLHEALHQPHEVLVYNTTQDGGVPEIRLPEDQPKVTSEVTSKQMTPEVSDPKYEIKVVINEEPNDVIEVVNLVPANKDKPQANRDSGYYSMPSESGLMSSGSINEGDSNVNEVFTPHSSLGSPYPVFEGQEFPFTSTPQGKINVEIHQNEDTLFVIEDVSAIPDTSESDKKGVTDLMDLSAIPYNQHDTGKTSSDLGLSQTINQPPSPSGLSGHVNETLEKEPSPRDTTTSHGMPVSDSNPDIDHSSSDTVVTGTDYTGKEPSVECPKQLTELNTAPRSSDSRSESQECSPRSDNNTVAPTGLVRKTGSKNEREDTVESSNSDSWSLEDTVKENNALQKGWSFEDESLRLDLADSGAASIGLSEFSTPRSDSTDAETTREVRTAIGQAVGEYALLHSMSVESTASDDTLAAACDLDYNLDDTLVTIEDADENAGENDAENDAEDESIDDSQDAGHADSTLKLQLPTKPRAILSPAASVSEDESLNEASDTDGEMLPLKDNLLSRLQADKDSRNSRSDGKSEGKSEKSENDNANDYSDSFESDSSDDEDNEIARKVYEAAAEPDDEERAIPSAPSAELVLGDLNGQNINDHTIEPHRDNETCDLDMSQEIHDVPHKKSRVDNNITSTEDTTEDTTTAPSDRPDCEGTQLFIPDHNTADVNSGLDSGLHSQSDPGSPLSKLQEVSVDEGYTTINTSELFDVSTMNDISLAPDSRATGFNRSLVTEVESQESVTDDEASVDELNQSADAHYNGSYERDIDTPLAVYEEQHSTPPLMSPATSQEDITNPANNAIKISENGIEISHEDDSTVHPDLNSQSVQPNVEFQDYEMPESHQPISESSDSGEFTVVHYKAPEPEKAANSDVIAEKLERAKDLVQSQLLMLEAADVLHQQRQLLDEAYPSLADEAGDEDTVDAMAGAASSTSGLTEVTPLNEVDTLESSDSRGRTPDEQDIRSMSKSPSDCVYEDDFEQLSKSSTARSVPESLVSSVNSSQQLSDDIVYPGPQDESSTNAILREIERTKQLTKISSESSLAVEVGDSETGKLDDDEAYEVTNAIHSPLKDESMQSEPNSSLLSSDSKDVADMIDPWIKVKVDNKRSQMQQKQSSLSMVAEMGDDQAEDVSVDIERMSDAEEDDRQRVGFAISEADSDAEPEDEVNISDYEGLDEAEVAEGDDSERWTHISRKTDKSKKSAVSMVVNIGEQEDEEAVSGSEDEDQEVPAHDAANAVIGHPIAPINGHLEELPDDHTSVTSGFASYDDYRKTESSLDFDAAQAEAGVSPRMPANIPSTSALKSRSSSMESAWSTTPTVGEMLEHIDEVASMSSDINTSNLEDIDEASSEVDDLIDNVRKERNELRHGGIEDSPEDSPAHVANVSEVDVSAAEAQADDTPIVLAVPQLQKQDKKAQDKPEKMDSVLKKFLDEHEMQGRDGASVELPIVSPDDNEKSAESTTEEISLAELDEGDNATAKEDKPSKPANFIDSKVTGFDVNPWEAVVRESPPLDGDTSQVVIGSQETLNVNTQKRASPSRGFQVLGLQPERIHQIDDDQYVYAEEPSVPCMDHLKHSAINIEIRPWKMAEGEINRPTSGSMSSEYSEEVTDISSDDSRAFVSAQDAQDILESLKRAMHAKNTPVADTNEGNMQEDAEIIVGPEAEHPRSFTSDAVDANLSNTGSTNPDGNFESTDFGLTTDSDGQPMIHLPSQDAMGATMRSGYQVEVQQPTTWQAPENVRDRNILEDYMDGPDNDTLEIGASQEMQRPISPSIDDLMKDVIAAQKEWLSIHGEDDAHSDRGSELAPTERHMSDIDSDLEFGTIDANEMAQILEEVSELPDLLVTQEYSSLRDTWLNRGPQFQRSLSMSELELIEPRDRYEGVSLSADCLITMDMQASKTMSSDSITYVFMSRPISCGDMVDLESWSPPHRRRSVSGLRRGMSMVDRASKRVIEEDRSVSAECLRNKFTDTNPTYLSYSADASRFIQPPDPFLGREGDIFGPQDDDTDYEGEPTNFFAGSYDSNRDYEQRSEQPTPNSLLDDASYSVGSDSVFDSTGQLAMGQGMDNLTRVGLSAENLSSDMYEQEQSMGERDKTKKAVSWGHISECVDDRPFVSVPPTLKIVPGSPEDSELNLLADSKPESKPGRRRSRSLSPSHAAKIENQLNKSNLAPVEAPSQTGDSLERVNRDFEDESIRQNHVETTQLLQEALQTIHKGMGTQTDDLPTASVNMQTDSPQPGSRDVSLPPNPSQSRGTGESTGKSTTGGSTERSTGGSTATFGPTVSGVFDGQSTRMSAQRRHSSDMPSRSSRERPLMLGSQNSSRQGSQDNLSYDSLRTSTRSLPDDYYRYMAPSPNDSLSQRTIETQTYPQVRYIETQTALQMRYIETQTEEEDLLSSTTGSVSDYSIHEYKTEEPLKIVVDTGVSPSPPLSPKEFGSQTDESFFSRTAETAMQTEPDAAVIRASTPELSDMIAIGLQAGTPHLSAADMTASSEDESSRIIHSRSRSRSRSRQRESSEGRAFDSSDEEEPSRSSRRSKRSRTRKVPVFSEIRGVLGTNAVPSGLPESPATSPRSMRANEKPVSVFESDIIPTIDTRTINEEEEDDDLYQPAVSVYDRDVIPVIDTRTMEEQKDNNELNRPAVSVYDSDIIPVIDTNLINEEDESEPLNSSSSSSRSTFRASQNLIDKVRQQVSLLDQEDDQENEHARSSEDIIGERDLSRATVNDRPATSSVSGSSDTPDKRDVSFSNSGASDSFRTSEANSSASGTTPSSASSRRTVISDAGNRNDTSRSQDSFKSDRMDNTSAAPSATPSDRASNVNAAPSDSTEDQAVYISKLGDVVIDSSVPISDEDANKLRAAVQAGDEDLLAKTIEEINQSLAKPSQGSVATPSKARTNETSSFVKTVPTGQDVSQRSPRDTKSGTYKVTIPKTETSSLKYDAVRDPHSRSPFSSSPANVMDHRDLERLGLSPVPSLEDPRQSAIARPQTNGSINVEPVRENIILKPSEPGRSLERPRIGTAVSTVSQHNSSLANGRDVLSRSPTTVMDGNDLLSVPKPRSRSASTQWEDRGDLQNTSQGQMNGAMSPPTKDASPNSSMKDEASETDFTDKMYDDELEQLRRERQRILDMLAKDMMPSKFQVELAEAQLNYIIGQTDTLLSTLDEPSVWDSDWLMQFGAPEAQLSEISQQHLAKYRQTLEASRLEIERRIELLERDRDRAERSRDRSRAMEMMKRDAQVQAFKLERHREQITYERTKMKSPRSRSESPDPRRASLGSHSPIPLSRFSPGSTPQMSFSQGPSHSTPLPSYGPHIPAPPSYSSVMSQRSSQGSSSQLSRSSRRDSQGSPAGSMFSSSSSFTSPDNLPSHMTPKQRKEHLIGLRKNLLSSSGELRSRSESPATTAAAKSKPLPRSFSPMFSYSTFSSPPSSVTSPKKTKRITGTTNYSLLSTAHPATDELHRETEERLSVKLYRGRHRDGSTSDTASISSLISSLDDDSIQLLNEYQEARGQADQEIIKAKETLQKKPSTKSSVKKTPANYLQRRLELESLKQQVEQSHQQHPTKDREELEKEIDSEIERLKMKYGSIGNNSTDASSRSSLLDKSTDGSSTYPPGGRTSTPQNDIQDTLRRYQSGSDTRDSSATKGSALDASTWSDSYLERLGLRTETSRSYFPSSTTRDYTPSFGRYSSPYSSSSSLTSSYAYRSYSSPYTGSARSGVSSRKPLHFTEPQRRGYSFRDRHTSRR